MSAGERQPARINTREAANGHGQPQRQICPVFSSTMETVLLQKVDEISGDILIDLENLPPEVKQTILLLVKNAADHDAAQKVLSDIMKQIEFDITAAELAAFLFKPGLA